jgi:hypothetical protein
VKQTRFLGPKTACPRHEPDDYKSATLPKAEQIQTLIFIGDSQVPEISKGWRDASK